MIISLGQHFTFKLEFFLRFRKGWKKLRKKLKKREKITKNSENVV